MTAHRHFGMTSRTVTTGACPPSGSLGVTQYYAKSIPLPSGSLWRPETALKTFNLSQAVLDGLAAIFWVLFLAALAGSLPLAVALMFVAAF
jgi:hypothetical protein